MRKLAGEALAIECDWSGILSAGVTISASVWTVFPTGATVGTPTISGQITAGIVSGGSDGQVYELTDTITASDGQTLAQRWQLYIELPPTIFSYTAC